VAGKTTIPFFTWLLAQPEFVAGQSTRRLDELLHARNGRAFVEPTAGPKIRPRWQRST
jgi:hypothetical protein